MGARSYCAAMLIAAGLAGCFSEHTSGPTIGGEGVTVGDILFQSNHNGSSNPAVDTVAVGTSVTWTWVNTGATPHSVESEGSPSFLSSGIMMGSGTVYTFQFTTRGRYDYNCAVHGSAMTGTIVVR
jgi:plastocyanin